jgi:hypothetical protein
MLRTIACYTIQLYADFSGYTNIALGVGKLFGVEGPPNFNAPFAAINIQEMWLMAFLGAALTFALMSFSQIFFHSGTFGQALSILAQILGVASSGPTGWSDMPANLTVPALICMGVAVYVGAGAPGARRLAGPVGAVAPQWLQYGVCLFLLTVLSTERSGRFIYGQF